ncbi:hypothetical protein CRYUN_Cryun39dG0032900 [Craigia yunnanensis]
MSRILELELQPEAFVKMRKLKFLKFYLPCSCGSFQKTSKVFLPRGLLSLPDELRYLCWEGYPLKTLPTKFYPRNLVEHVMSFSHVEQLWKGKQTSRAKNLENMHLVNCTNLLELPSSVQYLEKLTHLDLRLCKKHRFLPSLYKVRSLTTLTLSDCSILFSLPEISSNVRELHLEGTAIEEVPSSIESLCQFILLSVEDCARLRNFPTAICNLRSLEALSLSDSPKITTSPEISGNIRVEFTRNCNRSSSIVNRCSRLVIFPEILETMERLRNLDLSGTALKEFPSSIENLNWTS